jgi:hypothetical protein
MTRGIHREPCRRTFADCLAKKAPFAFINLAISEITSELNSRPSQSWTVMVEAMNSDLPTVDTRSYRGKERESSVIQCTFALDSVLSVANYQTPIAA